ncbi:hypothetical protein [Haloferula sp. BvORR071]|uniref:hypothetical protein n=1 Tax=Haloferula sp. BvORR071 TaxID=1396141 RepID=UPI00054F02BE|nr:hypothetical protein [Haloferula sp. BvORR071]
MRAFLYLVLTLLFSCRLCHGAEEAEAGGKPPGETPLTSPGKAFSIVRVNREPAWEDPHCIAEKVVFAKTSLGEAPLEVMTCRGIYFVSPDERWILRHQKTELGNSIAMLYRVEENGRVGSIQGFDERMWAASDAVSPIKFKDLYTAAIYRVSWSPDSKTLVLKIGGSHFSDGLEALVSYDLSKNTFQVKTPPDNQDEQGTK